MDPASHPARFRSSERATQAADRLLLLALDAVPHRAVAAACAEGAFAGWSAPMPVIAPFPSLTHGCFAALFAPFGVAPSLGYEVRYFDRAANMVVGGNPLTYRGEVPPWGRLLDTVHRGVVAKGSTYVTSMRAALAELDAILEHALLAETDAYLGYLGSTDALMHLYGDQSMAEFLGEVDRRVRILRDRHQSVRGRGLRVGIFSDHGCGRSPVHYTGDLRPLLRRAGLRVADRLDGMDAVVAPTFGIVNYLALFLADPRRAPQAAAVLCQHPAVDLAAWSPADGQVDVAGRAGEASLRWIREDDGLLLSCTDHQGDVLQVRDAIESMSGRGLLDADGFATSQAWLESTAAGPFPDGPARLVDALTGDRIRSRATVLASLGPGWSWGWRSAYLGSLVRGGRLKGTHGGLDRESSLAFLIVSEG
ncbi:MAG: alkaline phosphatase family protein, partial [Actinomycetales bacterium]|nr:alkaline phosphatase family protein [Actinomycetales bacterium]